MFRTSQGPSSGSHNLFLTEVAGFLCAVSVWLHILTLGVCVCRIGQGCTVYFHIFTMLKLNVAVCGE
jgi:hypothetical protein